MTANDRQEGGSHYQEGAVGICPHCRGKIQHWDWAQSLPYLEGAATKYLARWRAKGGLESLQKVLHYTQKVIETNFPGVAVTIEVRATPPETPIGLGIFGSQAPAGQPAHPRCVVDDDVNF